MLLITAASVLQCTLPPTMSTYLGLHHLLLGNSDPWFWFLTPALFALGAGMVVVTWAILETLVIVLATPVWLMRRMWPGRTENPGNMGKRWLLSVIRTATTLTLVTFVVPSQVALIFALLSLLYRCVMDRSRLGGPATHFLTTHLLIYTLLIPFAIPPILICGADLARRGSRALLSPTLDHDLVSAVPIVTLAELVIGGTGRTAIRASTGAIQLIEVATWITAVAAVAFGVRMAFVMTSAVWVVEVVMVGVIGSVVFRGETRIKENENKKSQKEKKSR